jgi:hypothetical protein
MGRIGGSLMLGALVAATLGAFPAPAGADADLGTVSGLTYIQSNSAGPAPPPAVLSSNATCPAATHVVGGGATSSSAAPSPPIEFWINRSRPFDGADPDTNPDDGWTATGYNRLGSTKAFGTYAICFAGSVSYVTASASATAGHGMVARASCPSAMHVAGGGAAVQGDATASRLNASHPFDSGDSGTGPDDGWRARGFNVSGSTKRLVAYAECVNLSPQYPMTSSNTTDPLLFSTCPSGTHAMGGGALPGGAPSQAFINTLYPYAGTTNPPDTGFVAIAHTTGGPLQFTNYAVCKA